MPGYVPRLPLTPVSSATAAAAPPPSSPESTPASMGLVRRLPRATPCDYRSSTTDRSCRSACSTAGRHRLRLGEPDRRLRTPWPAPRTGWHACHRDHPTGMELHRAPLSPRRRPCRQARRGTGPPTPRRDSRRQAAGTVSYAQLQSLVTERLPGDDRRIDRSAEAGSRPGGGRRMLAVIAQGAAYVTGRSRPTRRPARNSSWPTRSAPHRSTRRHRLRHVHLRLHRPAQGRRRSPHGALANLLLGMRDTLGSSAGRPVARADLAVVRHLRPGAVPAAGHRRAAGHRAARPARSTARRCAALIRARGRHPRAGHPVRLAGAARSRLRRPGRGHRARRRRGAAARRWPASCARGWPGWSTCTARPRPRSGPPPTRSRPTRPVTIGRPDRQHPGVRRSTTDGQPGADRRAGRAVHRRRRRRPRLPAAGPS